MKAFRCYWLTKVFFASVTWYCILWAFWISFQMRPTCTERVIFLHLTDTSYRLSFIVSLPSVIHPFHSESNLCAFTSAVFQFAPMSVECHTLEVVDSVAEKAFTYVNTDLWCFDELLDILFLLILKAVTLDVAVWNLSKYKAQMKKIHIFPNDLIVCNLFPMYSLRY